jgi:hypothetical protein
MTLSSHPRCFIVEAGIKGGEVEFVVEQMIQGVLEGLRQ